MSGDGSNGKRKIAMIGISSLLLVAMVVAATVGYSLYEGEMDTNSGSRTGTPEISASAKAIKSMCQSTDYKQTCVQSLTSEAGNSSDPKDLIKAAFKVAMKKIEEASKRSVVLKELEKDPRAKQALDSCKELMESAINDLKNSILDMGGFDISKLNEFLDDLKTWLSATITYQETCLDEFQNTTSDAGEKMKKALKTSAELTSNGLAIVSGLSSVLTSIQSPSSKKRRLLQVDDMVLGHGELPMGVIESPWLRKLLQEKDLLVHGQGEHHAVEFPGGLRRLLSVEPKELKPDIVVAKDGSGKYKTINEALKDVPKKSNKTTVMYIKEGVYEEQVEIERSMTHLYMIGDGANKTRITGNKNFVDGTTTYRTATVAVIGDHFMARNIGFENSAGAIKHQAVALRVQSDLSVFYNCSMDGYQDTLYTHTKRQFYRDCTITGTIDFIFGDASAVFQNCTFLCRKPLDNQQCIVTAQGRKERRQPSGIVFQNSTIASSAEYYPVRTQIKAYLGRPWKNFSRTIIMESYIDDLIQPEGWLPWMGDFALKTLLYAEFNNRGPGADTSKRVTWHGIKNMTREHAKKYTPGFFLWGDNWIPSTGVPYTSGLIYNKTSFATSTVTKADKNSTTSDV